ncbi:MAG: hypothetical protein NTX19_00190 [Gemmatimonadetes bacterium]|nr:hypothetical protein [Gemmatimonadota bacterium]
MARFTPAASAMKPLLNRFVFHGIQTCRGQLSSTAARVRFTSPRVMTLQALTTAAPERVAPELKAAGLVRVSRTADCEEWAHGSDLRLVLSSAASDQPESPNSVARDFAVLLTRTLALADDCAVRVSALVPQLALYWQAHDASNSSVGESEWLEDVIELVVRRDTIVDEVGAAPQELSEIIANASARFVASDSCRWVLRRALPDAREVPGFVEHARDRFIRLAAL